VKTSISLLATIAVLCLLIFQFPTNAATGPCGMNALPRVYDLKSDWSDTQNPNGTWSYRWGESVLINNPFPWVGTGYTGCPNGCAWPPNIPTIEKVSGTVNAYAFLNIYPGVLDDGDILVVPGNGGNILWTAPESGTIKISGSVWEADAFYLCYDPPMPGSSWTLTQNGNPLSAGSVWSSLCTSENPKASPDDFSSGSGGAAALQGIPVAAGDKVVLTFSGMPVSVNFTITLTPETGNSLFASDAIVWHQPLARNGASEDTDPSAGRTVKYRFKRGSTIPIQIHALNCDAADVTSNANVIGTVTVFGDSNCDGAADANAEPIEFNGVGGGGGVMDKIGGHLKYNLDTKSLPTTSQCYILRVTVTDTSTGEEKFEEVLLQAK
jgi:hypothetical protein